MLSQKRSLDLVRRCHILSCARLYNLVIISGARRGCMLMSVTVYFRSKPAPQTGSKNERGIVWNVSKHFSGVQGSYNDIVSNGLPQASRRSTFSQ